MYIWITMLTVEYVYNVARQRHVYCQSVGCCSPSSPVTCPVLVPVQCLALHFLLFLPRFRSHFLSQFRELSQIRFLSEFRVLSMFRLLSLFRVLPMFGFLPVFCVLSMIRFLSLFCVLSMFRFLSSSCLPPLLY